MPFTAVKVKVLPYCLLTTFALKLNSVLIMLVLHSFITSWWVLWEYLQTSHIFHPIYQWARQRARDQSNLKIVSAGLYTTLWHMCQQPPATNYQPVMESTLQTGYWRRSLTGLCGCVNGGFSNQFHSNYLQPPGTTQKLNFPSWLVARWSLTSLSACVSEAYEVWCSILVHKTYITHLNKHFSHPVKYWHGFRSPSTVTRL